ncbi:hydroxymethylbilane synthase [Kutzneria sp. 744]|nr:hydroxymethylbilane synthase [Kutzneria sp. 744]
METGEPDVEDRNPRQCPRTGPDRHDGRAAGARGSHGGDRHREHPGRPVERARRRDRRRRVHLGPARRAGQRRGGRRRSFVQGPADGAGPAARAGRRADPRGPQDALVARDGMVLGELPAGSRVGTGAARRVAQLEALGLGLELVPIRGNVDTRIRKVSDGELDAVVVAAAGLSRLGRLDVVTEFLDPIQMLPSPAQGALAVECRVDDVDTEHLLRSCLDDQASRAAVTAERAMLAALEAGCSAPVGALADVVEDLDDDGRTVLRLSLRGVAATPQNELLRASATGDLTTAEQLGRALAAELLDLGATVLSGPGSK